MNIKQNDKNIYRKNNLIHDFFHKIFDLNFLSHFKTLNRNSSLITIIINIV